MQSGCLGRRLGVLKGGDAGTTAAALVDIGSANEGSMVEEAEGTVDGKQ